MNSLQIYWLTWAPSLLLVFVFFGPYGALTIFIPSFAVYFAHHKEISVWKFTVIATLSALAILAMFTVIPDTFF